MYGWISGRSRLPAVVQLFSRQLFLQQLPHGLGALVQQKGLALFHIEIHGVCGAVGTIDRIPCMTFGWLLLILAAHHPHGCAVIRQLGAVERAGKLHPLDLLGQTAEVEPEIGQRKAEAYNGQHSGQQAGTLAFADLTHADAGKNQHDRTENGRTKPGFVVAKYIKHRKIAEALFVHLGRNGNCLGHEVASFFGIVTHLYTTSKPESCKCAANRGRIRCYSGKGDVQTLEKKGKLRRITLKERMILCLAAFFAALGVQIALSGYQSTAVQAVLDQQMGCFHAISRFQGGVENAIGALEDYRWESGEGEDVLDRLKTAQSTCNAWLWRIETGMDGLENVSDEQWVLYGAVQTTYRTYTGLLEELEQDLTEGRDADGSQLYYSRVSPCGGYLSQYTLQLLETSILDAQSSYTELSALNERINLLQTVVVGICVALGCITGMMVMRLLTPVQQMIVASRAIGRSEFDTPDIPIPKQPEIGQLAESFNRMKHSMAQQVSTLQEKNEIERELHRQKTQALELQNRMERSRLQQLRSQIDPHFLFNTLNVIQQTAATEKGYRTQALIMALSHLLRYSLMSNDEQVPLSREVRIVDEYYSIYHVRFGERVQMEWRISDSLDMTETMVPSFILQPIVENAFKHGICPKEEGGIVRIRIVPLREKGLLCIRILDNGMGIQPAQLQELRAALAQRGSERSEHIGIYNVAARLHLLDARCRLVVRSRPGQGTAVVLYLPLVENEEEELEE